MPLEAQASLARAECQEAVARSRCTIATVPKSRPGSCGRWLAQECAAVRAEAGSDVVHIGDGGWIGKRYSSARWRKCARCDAASLRRHSWAAHDTCSPIRLALAYVAASLGCAPCDAPAVAAAAAAAEWAAAAGLAVPVPLWLAGGDTCAPRDGDGVGAMCGSGDPSSAGGTRTWAAAKARAMAAIASASSAGNGPWGSGPKRAVRGAKAEALRAPRAMSPFPPPSRSTQSVTMPPSWLPLTLPPLPAAWSTTTPRPDSQVGCADGCGCAEAAWLPDGAACGEAAGEAACSPSSSGASTASSAAPASSGVAPLGAVARPCTCAWLSAVAFAAAARSAAMRAAMAGAIASSAACALMPAGSACRSWLAVPLALAVAVAVPLPLSEVEGVWEGVPLCEAPWLVLAVPLGVPLLLAVWLPVPLALAVPVGECVGSGEPASSAASASGDRDPFAPPAARAAAMDAAASADVRGAAVPPADTASDAEAGWLGLGECVPAGDAPTDLLPVAVPVTEPLTVPLGVALPLGDGGGSSFVRTKASETAAATVPDTAGVGTSTVAGTVGDGLAAMDGEMEPVSVADGVTAALGDAEPFAGEASTVPDADGAAGTLCEADDDGDTATLGA